MVNPIKKMFDASDAKSLNNTYRQVRFKFFLTQLESVKSQKPLSILDIGGTQLFWEIRGFKDFEGINITLLNLHLEKIKFANFISIQGDACNLSNFKDKEFDVVFSNSVIEHLFTKENQQKMANEVRRVGKAYYIQTPNYFFPIEPHWLFPFFHYLPFNLKVFLTKYLPLGRHAKDTEKAKQLVKEVRLLTKKEMQRLFPEGNVYSEKFYGLTKSITLYSFPKP